MRALALQRAAGNRATARVLARDKGTDGAPVFRLLIADDDKTGLDDGLVDTALESVRKEIQRITKDSADDTVKAGFDVQHIKSAPERNDDFTHDLGRRTFLIFLTKGRDAKHGVELVWKYIPMSKEERKQREEEFKKGIAAEGGVDMETFDVRRRGEQSVGFVGTDGPLQELKKPQGGKASAAAVLADVILHELGHALGHNKTLASMDHDKAGIMEAHLIIDSGPYQLRQYSTASAKIIRERLEELAKRLAPKRP